MKRKEREKRGGDQLLVEAIVSSCPSVRENKAGEEESMSLFQGPMRRGTNCRNERNEMMESCWVLVVCLSVRIMVANTYFKTKARDEKEAFETAEHR